LIYSTDLSETLPILRRNEPDMIKIYIGLHVKYSVFMSDFNEPWIFYTDVRKISKYKISWKCVQWEPSYSTQTDGWTDRQDAVYCLFRNFANVSNNNWPRHTEVVRRIYPTKHLPHIISLTDCHKTESGSFAVRCRCVSAWNRGKSPKDIVTIDKFPFLLNMPLKESQTPSLCQCF